MQALVIVRPLPIASIASSSGEASAALLASPSPKEAFVASSTGARSITWDTGAVSPIDTVHVGWINAPDGATITVTINGSVLGASAPAAGQPGMPRHLFVKAATPITGRNITVTLNGFAGVTAQVGTVAAGLAWSAQWGQEWGAGRTLGDTSSVERLFGGSFGVDEGVSFTGYQWTFGDLQTAERESLYALLYGVGIRGNVLVIEDIEAGAGLNERVHWSKFTKLEAFERVDPTNSRWSLRVDDWA